MAKRKRRVSKKQLAPQHKLPDGFWQQAAAVVLVVVALLLVVAMFGAGGPLMEAVLNAGEVAVWLGDLYRSGYLCVHRVRDVPGREQPAAIRDGVRHGAVFGLYFWIFPPVFEGPK